MNQTIVKPNEFILRVVLEDDKVLYQLHNPHTQTGADGKYDKEAYMAAYALLHTLAAKLRRVQKPEHNPDNPDFE